MFSLPEQLEPLKALNHWVAWELRPGNMKKIPLNPHTGKYAEQDNSETWGAFNEAYTLACENSRKKGMQIGMLDGVGFQFGVEPCGIAGIDLDHVINDKGELANWAREVVELMDSYTELSPSGKGLHILFKVDGNFDNLHELFGGQWGRNNRKKGIEIYVARHYFTITGNVYGSPRAIRTATDEMKKVYRKYFTDTDRQSTIADWKYNPDNYHPSPSPVEAHKPSNSELWQKMFNATNGARIHALFNGDISGYPSQSEADQALCNDLAYWTNGDAVQMDSMFRETALMRDKWDEIHSGSQTYGQATIAKAIYDTPRYEAGQSNSNTRNQKQSASTGDASTGEREREAFSFDFHSMAVYSQLSLISDIKQFTSFAHRETGYFNIDQHINLFNGLYVIGAVSSLGKTSFCLQMADQLAEAGENVLYFSLEQSKFDLATKSISRLTAIENLLQLMDGKPHEAVTAIDIRKGTRTDTVKHAHEKYSQLSRNLVILQCGFNTTIDYILEGVKAYIKETGKKPVVFVDYLQCIKNNNDRLTEKQVLDAHVQALKQLSLNEDIPVILISSFNRENYLSIVDFTSFSGSSGIEYTADFVLGLQLLGMNAKVFNQKADLSLKRKFARLCMAKQPRQIEGVVLKNRYGQTGLRFFFDYFAAYDYFRPNLTDAEILETNIRTEYDAFAAKYNEGKESDKGGSDTTATAKYSKVH